MHEYTFKIGHVVVTSRLLPDYYGGYEDDHVFISGKHGYIKAHSFLIDVDKVDVTCRHVRNRG